MKAKLITIFATVVLMLALMPALGVFAQSDVSVTIDGAPVHFPIIGPQIVQDRTLVPVRGVFEALGFEVDWYEPAQQVTLTRYDYRLVLTVGSAIFETNGVEHSLEVPAQIIADSTFLPLRSPLESIGYALGWCQDTRTVSIVTTGELPPEPEPTEPLPPAALTAEEHELRVFELTNIERANHGVAPLVWSDSLAYAARLHSEDMAQNVFMNHTGSDGSTPWERMDRAGFIYSRAAENVAYGQRSAEQVVGVWMNSDGHRRNILDPNLTELGVGFAEYRWTQKFGAAR